MGYPTRGKSFFDSDEPDFEGIVERRHEARAESDMEREERSYERHMQGY